MVTLSSNYLFHFRFMTAYGKIVTAVTGGAYTSNATNVAAGNALVSATAPSSPQDGAMWYDSTNAVLKVWNGSAWVDVTTG